ncbi:MAG: hypothetical protein CMN28_10720 [Salinisphaeraceae bacterium]|nr:hypothetical protein [Salinisphaeraceae bacterium]
MNFAVGAAPGLLPPLAGVLTPVTGLLTPVTGLLAGGVGQPGLGSLPTLPGLGDGAGLPGLDALPLDLLAVPSLPALPVAAL